MNRLSPEFCCRICVVQARKVSVCASLRWDEKLGASVLFQLPTFSAMLASPVDAQRKMVVVKTRRIITLWKVVISVLSVAKTQKTDSSFERLIRWLSREEDWVRFSGEWVDKGTRQRRQVVLIPYSNHQFLKIMRILIEQKSSQEHW